MAQTALAPALGSSDDVCWRGMYQTGAIAALVTVVLFLVQLIAYFVWPPPSSVAGHFALLQARPFVGLVSLDLFILVDEVLAIPICLALYFSLRRGQASLMLLATALEGVSILCFLLGTPALNMLHLSNQYAVASTSAQKEALLAVGESLMWSSALQIGYFVGTLGMLLVGWAMLRSQVFRAAAGYVGILAALLGFGIYLPKFGVQLSLLSVVGMQVWYVMIARTLWSLRDDWISPSHR